MNAQICKAIIYQNGACVLLARVLDDEGEPIEQSTTDTISIVVTDMTDETSTTVTPAPDKADAISDVLIVNDSRWTVDRVGFNFVTIVAAEYFPQGQTTYQIDVAINRFAGDPLPIIYQTQTLARFTS